MFVRSLERSLLIGFAALLEIGKRGEEVARGHGIGGREKDRPLGPRGPRQQQCKDEWKQAS